MNDSKNEIGSNWGSGTPRTMRQAWPRGRIGGEWDKLRRDDLSERRDDVITVLIMVLSFLLGCVIGPVIMFDPSIVCFWN